MALKFSLGYAQCHVGWGSAGEGGREAAGIAGCVLYAGLSNRCTLMLYTVPSVPQASPVFTELLCEVPLWLGTDLKCPSAEVFWVLDLGEWAGFGMFACMLMKYPGDEPQA